MAELQKQVKKLYIVKRPLQSSRNTGGSSANAVTHEGCIAVTSDGENYLLEKGVAPDDLRELQRIGGAKGSRIVKVGSKMPQDFALVKEVKVTKSAVTLNDLLQASGVDYDWMCNNCWNSTEEMQKVVNNELHLSWQMRKGMEVGMFAVVAMALFAIGKFLIGGPMRH